jgi:hypothetical protein
VQQGNGAAPIKGMMTELFSELEQKLFAEKEMDRLRLTRAVEERVKLKLELLHQQQQRQSYENMRVS